MNLNDILSLNLPTKVRRVLEEYGMVVDSIKLNANFTGTTTINNCYDLDFRACVVAPFKKRKASHLIKE